MTRPIVGIDVSAVPAQPRGAGRYIVELVRALHARDQIDLRLESRRSDRSRWVDIAGGARVDAVVPDDRGRRMVWEQTRGPSFVDRWGIDVHHGPHYTTPERTKVPKVVTVHDMTFFDHPEHHERLKVPIFKRAITQAVKRADALVCVSEPTARRLRQLLDPQCPVHVIPHGIDHRLFTVDAQEADDARLLEPLGARPPFVAFAATLEPRKDVGTLVRAFDRIADDHPQLQLVVAGGQGWGPDTLGEALASARHRDRVVRTGYVDDAVVPALFRRSEAVVYAAIEEGFGLPVLEALACGAPVITTAGSVMDELAGGAALTVPFGEMAALAAAVDRLVCRDDGLASRRSYGLEVAARYTWERTAAAHESVYRAVADSASGAAGSSR